MTHFAHSRRRTGFASFPTHKFFANFGCHSERTGPQTSFSLGVVSEESAFAFLGEFACDPLEFHTSCAESLTR